MLVGLPLDEKSDLLLYAGRKGRGGSVCALLLGGLIIWGKEGFKKLQGESSVISRLSRERFEFVC